MIHPSNRAERLKINAQKKSPKVKGAGFKRIVKDRIRDWETSQEVREVQNNPGLPG